MAQSLDGDMAQPKKFNRVVWRSMFFITAANLAFGVICVLVFRDQTQQNIIDNLGTSVVVKIVRVLLCVDLLFTVPMVLAFGREVLEKSLFDSALGARLTARNALVASILLRTLLVAVVIGIAVGVMDSPGGVQAFGNLINLVGGGVNSLLGLILPPLFHLKSLSLQNALTVPALLAHGAIITLGLALLGSSTYFTMVSFISG
jgi:hypothetical protein